MRSLGFSFQNLCQRAGDRCKSKGYISEGGGQRDELVQLLDHRSTHNLFSPPNRCLAMAASGRRSVITLLCVVVVTFFLLGDGAAALSQDGKREPGIVGSTKEFYLRGNPTIIPNEDPTEESFDSFARRELQDGYGTDPASANCDTNRTNCP